MRIQNKNESTAVPATLRKGGGGLDDDVTVDDMSSDFKEENGLHCLVRAKMNMKNTKKTVYHCHITLVKYMFSLM